MIFLTLLCGAENENLPQKDPKDLKTQNCLAEMLGNFFGCIGVKTAATTHFGIQ